MKAAIENRDYTLIIDKSGSMSSVDKEGGLSRWQAAAESTEAVAREILKYDPDGITIYTFSTDFHRKDNVTSAQAVKDIFTGNRPEGVTNLAEVLDHAIKDYFRRRDRGQMQGKKGETILVVTDGQPYGKSRAEERVKEVIVKATKKMKRPDELAISFFQIGDDAKAKEYLRVLDDDLEKKYKAKYDIVDTKTFEDIEEIGLTKALIDAIYD